MTNLKQINALKILLIAVLYLFTLAIFYLGYSSQSSINQQLNVARLTVFIILLPILIKYLVQLIAIPCYSLFDKRRSKQNINSATMSVSVLIPAYNEQVGIIKTIQSVLDNNYPSLEIIVINDGSTDGTDQIVTDFIVNLGADNSLKPQIKYLKLSNGGKSNAINQGLTLAKNDIVMTIDGDCVMAQDTIKNTVKRFHHPSVGAVAGNVVIGNKSKTIEVMQQLEYLSGFFLRRADSVFNAVFIIGGAAAAYRRSVLVEMGPFSTDIVTEDIDMSTRILAAGYKSQYAADAVTYTEGPSNWTCLFSQRLRWKFGRFQTLLKFKHLFFSTQRQHNKYLTWLILPIAVYAEFVLLIELVIVSLFFFYTFYCNDYLPIIIMISFMTSLIAIQIACDSKRKFHANLLILAPIAWLLFYLVDVVEFQALYRSLKRLLKKQHLQWQKWVRVGL